MEPVPAYLASLTARSLGLFAVALVAIGVFRVKTAAARHAVWTLLVIGMLLSAVLALVAPALSLRMLPGSTVVTFDVATPSVTASGAARSAPVRPAASVWQSLRWDVPAVACYLLVAIVLLARLVFGYLFTRRLAHASRRTELGADEIYESTWISVPLTIGWAAPKILLPAEWREWQPDKLAAALAHERSHVRRADWGIALLAGVNRCLFWFHPLAWWLERRLAALAEQACDDAALLELGSREPYAEALLDMAAAVKTGHGRLVWEAMAMAKASEVRMRIERILDETRQIPQGIPARRWAVLAACVLPMIYLASVLQFAPALAQGQEAKVSPPASITQMTAAEAGRMEQELTVNPDDIGTRSKLIAYYFVHNIREPRLTYILWLIEHHPESQAAAFNSGGISPRPNALNTPTDYERASALWRQQVAVHPNDPRVLANAAQFFGQRGGDWYEAERLLQQARSLPGLAGFSATASLAALYSKSLNVSTDASGAVHFPALDENATFANNVIAELENSTDGELLFQTANLLRSPAPNADATLQRLTQPRIDFGEKLLARAQQFGVTRPPLPPGAIAQMRQSAMPQTPTAKQEDFAAVPRIISRVDPIPVQGASGDVRLSVTIGADGRVNNISVVQGQPALIKSALDAVRQWTFTPVRENGAAVPASFPLVVTVPLDTMPHIQGDAVPTASQPPLPMANSQQPPPSMPTRIRVGGNVQAHMLIQKVDPVYPEQARTAGPDGSPLEGTVKLTVVIGKDGHVLDAQPTEGHPLLAPAAVDAVKRWVYKTTTLNGIPVEVSTTVDVKVGPA